MTTRRDEIQFELDLLTLEDRFLSAKAARNDSPEAEAAFQAIKREFSQARTEIRQLIEAAAPDTSSDGDANATVDPIVVTSSVKGA